MFIGYTDEHRGLNVVSLQGCLGGAGIFFLESAAIFKGCSITQECLHSTGQFMGRRNVCRMQMLIGSKDV